MHRGELKRGIALEATRADIASRLRPLCAHFTEAEFTALVEHITEIDVRYRFREDWTFLADRDSEKTIWAG